MSSWSNRSIKKKVPHIIHNDNNKSPEPVPNICVVSDNIIVSAINYIYCKDIALNNTYEDTLNRIEIFNKKNNDEHITFIIPTINRRTLSNALVSLINQSVTNWKAIIVFDGCTPTDRKLLELLSDSRFLYISINKLGTLKDSIGIHGTAGYVRNIGMSLVTTPWIGFLDDDDTLCPNYTAELIKEIMLTPQVDLIIFRMIDDNKIYPPNNINTIISGLFGISFCFKTQLYQEGFKFKQSGLEDYYLLKDIQDTNHKIVISPNITYNVRNSTIIDNTDLVRVIIN
jgi:glycosyltransferase involved in cell wall biosynthesis